MKRNLESQIAFIINTVMTVNLDLVPVMTGVENESVMTNCPR